MEELEVSFDERYDSALAIDIIPFCTIDRIGEVTVSVF
jgi:hypothetical protein